MESYKKLLAENKRWAEAQALVDPMFFTQMAAGQSPEFLWIGCADSRAPADKITNTQPGQIFVHRNVANLVLHNDFNMLSVLQYAVEVLKVKHIMVVGHYGCGGVKASMSNDDLGLINKWVRNIKDVYQKHNDELEAIEDETAKTNRLCELNVVEQTRNLVKTTIVQKAWANGHKVHIHGWILQLDSGLIKQIFEVAPGDLSVVEPIYRYNITPTEKES
ncbi:carbonic anhydrase [Spirosomataceae bacterium TFI 002]|nr:carbonic anhydrase [Spirosomataceae bacterium TFI 002]